MYNFSFFRMREFRASKPEEATRNLTFFQLDFDNGNNQHLPEILKNRILLVFSVDSLPKQSLDKLSQWMKEKWDEIPLDGQIAFQNLVCSFITTQTVILGESGYNITAKVLFTAVLHENYTNKH